MLFSETLKEKLVKVFCRENIKNKLTKEELKDGINIEWSDIVFSFSYFIINISFIMIFCIICNTIKYILYSIFGQGNHDGLIFFLSIIVPLVISVCSTKYLCHSNNKSIKTLQKKINEDTIMNALKISLKEIINDSKSSKESVIEAKNYISMLTQGKDDFIYKKINEEKIFFIKFAPKNSNILKEYHLCCVEEKSNLEQKILSSEEITKMKIDKLESSGFNANLEIDKILQKTNEVI